MLRWKDHRTLQEELEGMKKKEPRRRGKRWIKILFPLLFLAFGHLLGYALYVAYGFLVIELMRCLFARRGFRKNRDQTKVGKQTEWFIRDAAESILVMYLLFVCLVVFIYIGIFYVLHISIIEFPMCIWLRYSFLLFLLSEVLLLRFYRKNEREVG
mgnify:FL=1